MKPAVVFLMGLASGVVLMIVMCVTDTMPMECGCVSYEDTAGVNDSLPPAQGVVITEAEFNLLKNRFQNPTLGSTTAADEGAVATEPGQGAWGGRIGKKAILKLLTNLRPGEEFIDFRFGLSDEVTNPKIYLMFISKGLPAGTEKLYISNGGDLDSWCPLKCD